MTKAGTAVEKIRTFRSNAVQGSIFRGEALTYLEGIRSESATLVLLDPPFNLGKIYSLDQPDLDRKSPTEYHAWLLSILAESERILRPGGTLYVYHLPIWAMRLGNFLDQRLSFRHWIAISMKNGFARGKRLYPAHYALLMFTKGEPLRFQRPKLIPKRCRHCGEVIKDYGGYRSIIEEKGLNLSDFWDDLSPVRHKQTKHRRANELPPLLFERVFSMSGFPSGLYVDPFAGAGSGVLAAIQAGMRFSCSDLLEVNCDLIEQRLLQSRRTRG